MPRVGDVFQLLSGTLAVPNTTIASSPYNAQQNDWVTEANSPRPVSAGGTGGTTAETARTSLGAFGADDLFTADTKAVPVATDSFVIIDSEWEGEAGEEDDTTKYKRVLLSDMTASLATITDVPITLISTDSTATPGPAMVFDRQSTTPAINDHLGYIDFKGRNSADETHSYAGIVTTILNPINSEEAGGMEFRRSVAGGISTGLSLNGSGVTVHQGLTVLGASSFTGAATFDAVPTFNAAPVINANLSLVSTNASNAAGPILYFDRISASPAAGDLLGEIFFRGRSSAAATVTYADVYCIANDVTTSTMDSSLVFRTQTAGSMGPALTLGATLATIHSPLSVTGSITSSSSITSSGNFIASGASVFLATTGAGTIYLRPNGAGSATGQVFITAGGNLNSTGNISLTSGNITASAGDITAVDITATHDVTATNIITTDAGVVASGSGVVSLRPAGGGSGTGALRLTATTLGVFGDTGAARGALATPTGTVQRTTYATSSVTLPQLAGVVMAIIADLKAMGFFS